MLWDPIKQSVRIGLQAMCRAAGLSWETEWKLSQPCLGFLLESRPRRSEVWREILTSLISVSASSLLGGPWAACCGGGPLGAATCPPGDRPARHCCEPRA